MSTPQQTLEARIDSIELIVKSITESVAALNIDKQTTMRTNTPIPPGVATKVAYDSNGLITQAIKLTPADIPVLKIDKISGLSKMLDDKLSSHDIHQIKAELAEMYLNHSVNTTTPVSTGIKVNYNTDGCIVSSAELLPSDIPQLPIEKIDGLSDMLIFNTPAYNADTTTKPNIVIRPGTYTKVTVDKYGNVVAVDKLSMYDMPSMVTETLNRLETRMSSLVDKSKLDIINKSLQQKVNLSTANITPGTYTKVTIDKQGLVTYGEKINLTDLPSITVADVTDLEDRLRSCEESIAQLTRGIDELNNYLAKNTNDDMQDSINRINIAIESITKRVTRNAGDISGLESSVKGIESDLRNAYYNGR